MSRPSSTAKLAKPSSIKIKVLRKRDQNIFAHVARGVFDHDINRKSTLEFLGDPRHHMAVALENGIVVGMASAVHYIHPDKAPELWINEVGVAKSHRRRRIGSKLIARLLEIGRELGCVEAWVLTEQTNAAAIRLYSSQGGKRAPKDPVMFTFRLGTAKH